MSWVREDHDAVRDFAVLGHALDDVAQLAWYAVPSRPVEQQRRASIEGNDVLRSRERTVLSTPGGVGGR